MSILVVDGKGEELCWCLTWLSERAHIRHAGCEVCGERILLGIEDVSDIVSFNCILGFFLVEPVRGFGMEIRK